MAKEEHVNIRKYPFWKRKEIDYFLNAFVHVEKALNEINEMASSQDESDVFDNWEDLDKTEVLEQKLKQIVPRAVEIEPKSCNNQSPVNVILIGDDAVRSQYVPPEPTVKILKRPSKDAQSQNGDCRPRQPIKTLKQREQEYAEARLRILGEAHSSEKDCDNKISGIQNKVAAVGCEAAAPIVRLPRGPDGTRGFNVRR